MDNRITEEGEERVTEDGEVRALEIGSTMTHAVFDVRAHFGALGDDTADDTLAIQAAIDAAAALPYGGVVLLPPGKYRHTGLQMKTRVTLTGYGPPSILTGMPGATPGAWISLAGPEVNHTVLRDLYIDGNRQEGAGPGGTGTGIHYLNSEDHQIISQAELFGFHGDPQHRIFNVHVFNCSGDGISLWTCECQVANCHISRCAETSLVVEGSDNWLSDISINWADKRGVLVNGGANQFSKVKCWYIGLDPLWVEGDAFTISSDKNLFVGCSAEDVSRHGLYFTGGDHNEVTGMVFDNVGNLFQHRQLGMEHAPSEQVSAIRLGRGLSANGATHNKVSGTVSQGGSGDIAGLDYAVNVRPEACFNHILVTCIPDVIRGGGAMLNPGNETSRDNFVMINNRLV